MRNDSIPVIFPAILAALILPACSHHKTVKEEVRRSQTEALNNSVAAKNHASFYTEISFPKGSSLLSDADQRSLRDLMDHTINSGKVDQIKVISWADEAYTDDEKKSLRKESQGLAEARARKVKNFLAENYPSLKVNTYNMAKRPGSFDKMFHTADASTKQTFLDAGATADGSHATLQAKKSKVLVLSVLEN